MALPVPSSPLTIPDFTGNGKARGPEIIDPTTKSALSLPVVFEVEDICGNDAYVEFRAAVNINELTTDCQNVQAGTLSIKGRIPSPGNAADFQAMLSLLSARISAALIV